MLAPINIVQRTDPGQVRNPGQQAAAEACIKPCAMRQHGIVTAEEGCQVLDIDRPALELAVVQPGQLGDLGRQRSSTILQAIGLVDDRGDPVIGIGLHQSGCNLDVLIGLGIKALGLYPSGEGRGVIPTGA